MLNKQGPGKIAWTDFSWNPLSGCQHGCDYCYINKMDKRYGSNIMTPAYHPDRMDDLIRKKKLKPGTKIFVGSSGDTWGGWVDKTDIMCVLLVIKQFPDLTFQFLTKNPRRYAEFEIPKNCLRGATIDTNGRAVSYMNGKKDIDFISFEPLLTEPNAMMLSWIDEVKWIIIGGESGGTKKPDLWADILIERARACKVPVFVKSNYKYHTKIQEHLEGK